MKVNLEPNIAKGKKQRFIYMQTVGKSENGVYLPQGEYIIIIPECIYTGPSP
jgi:hypothetical protein